MTSHKTKAAGGRKNCWAHGLRRMSVHHTGEGMSKIMAECGCGQGSIHGSRPGSRPSDLCLLARPHLLKALQI